jgi:hypothetical protein
MSQYPRPVGPTSINDAAPFTSSMTAGYQPEKGFKGRQEWHTGWSFLPPDIPPVSVESTVGNRPDSPRLTLWRNHAGWFGQPPEIPLPFPFESTSAQHPDTSRAQAPKRGPSFFPWSGTTDPSDQPSMFAGCRPDRSRQHPVHKTGWISDPQVDIFSPDQVIGNHPDRARFFMGPRTIGWFSQELTHVAAPVSQEMMNGNHPDRNRAFVYPKTGWSVSQTTFDVPMTPEMFAGSHPDSPRIRLGPRIPLPVSQTTQVNAPITLDMLRGYQPEKAFKFTAKPGLRLMPNDTITPPPIAFHTETNSIVPFNPQPWIK